MDKKLMVVDGNSLLCRAFYALPIMSTGKGVYTNGLLGFFRMLINVTAQEKPDYLAVAFDVHGKTFRHEEAPWYKAGRKEAPPELPPQFPLLRNSLRRLGICILEKERYEADDILGTLSKIASAKGMRAVLLTGDRDALQLIDNNTSVYFTKKGVSEMDKFDEALVKERFGLTPLQIVEYKGLSGDKSDNIPGIPGIGDKTAMKLLTEYQTVQNIYNHIDEVKGSVKDKLIANRELANLCLKTATIYREVPLDVTIEEDMRFIPLTVDRVRDLFEELEFRALLNQMTTAEAKQKKEEERLKREKMVGERLFRGEPNVVFVDDVMSLRELVKEFTQREKVAFYFGDAFYIAGAAGTEYKVAYSDDGMLYRDVVGELAPLFKSDIKKIFHGLKDAMHELSKYGISVYGECFDTLIAAYVIKPTQRDYSLKALCDAYGVHGHAAALLSIEEEQRLEIEEKELQKIFYDIESPLIKVLFNMEQEGFTVDEGAIGELAGLYSGQVESLAREIYGLCGEEFNINSTKQLGTILFEKLGLEHGRKTKSGYSTDAEVLAALVDKHPVIQKILDYRQVAKFKSTYIDGISALADKETYKVHTTFKQETTATGRISSIEPNLQNIPVRTELGREIRRVFIPSAPDRVIISADYSQIELRILAHIADDPVMIEAFLNDEDIHARTAAQVFGVGLDEVVPEMRRSAKAVNFGIVYGISGFGLAKNLSIGREQAGEFIVRYLQEFSGVEKYMNSVKTDAKILGYVKTLFGRVRELDELNSSSHNIRAFGERAALNTPIQGTAADIIKLAMIRVHNSLAEKGLESKLILQVHDELIVDALKSEQEQVIKVLRDEMQNVVKLKVPLVVNVAVGENWNEAK